jgi:hypothetical protein
MQYLFVFYFALIIGQTNTDYDYNNFSNKLLRLKNEYLHALQTETDVDDLLDKFKDINRKTIYLKTELEEYIKKNLLNKNTKYQDLLWETKEFNTFSSNSPTCECLSNFKDILKIFDGQSVFLKEQDGLRIFGIRLGNFDYYYAYSRDLLSYDIVIESSYVVESSYSRGSSRNAFGLWGEIEVFTIREKNKILSINKVSVTPTHSPLEWSDHNCKNEFPRF